MIQARAYVCKDKSGAYRIGASDVSLDSVVIGFQEGHTAETIQQLYPALSLEEVYGAIAFYLANRDEVDAYLAAQEQLWERLRAAALATPSPVAQRLRARKERTRETAP